MFIFKYLKRSLTKLRYLNLQSCFFYSRHWSIKIYILLVCQMIKEVIISNCRSSSLFETKNKVYPFIQMSWYVIWFKRGSHFKKEVFSRVGPFRDNYIINWLSFRRSSHFQFLWIDQEIAFWRVKLRNKFFEVSNRVHSAEIGSFDTSKDSIWRRKHSILDSHDKLRYFSDQKITDIPWCRIVSWVDMWRIA